MALARRFARSVPALALATVAVTGCARQAQVQAESLALKRVVIYRNGVGYFERGGHVDTNEVRFKMKEAEIGDFLATLAVMEQGGSSVRAAAFLLDVDDDVVDGSDEKDTKGPPKTEDERRGLKKIVLALDGRSHDLDVGYIASAPVWRASYRLVVRKDGKADLQAWGIVQNLSGEDWKDVKLSLVAGAPLSFEAQLGTAVIPARPTVTDEGEVIAAVPKTETTLAQGATVDAPSPPPATPSPAQAEAAATNAAEDDDAPRSAPSAGAIAGKATAKRDAAHRRSLRRVRSR